MDAGYTGEGKGANWVERVFGLDGTDRAPPTEDGSGRGNEEVGERVGQRGRVDRCGGALGTAEVGRSASAVGGVERTFAWLGQNCRMSKDYERLAETSEAFVYVAMTRLMVRRLARS
jgi:hypothetical protein